jgi:hypothetical protein
MIVTDEIVGGPGRPGPLFSAAKPRIRRVVELRMGKMSRTEFGRADAGGERGKNSGKLAA